MASASESVPALVEPDRGLTAAVVRGDVTGVATLLKTGLPSSVVNVSAFAFTPFILFIHSLLFS